MDRARSRLVGAASLFAVLASSCGAGTAGLVSGGGGGSGGNAPPAVSSFTIDDPKTSPTVIRFVLSDTEGDPAEIDLRYQVGGAPAQRLTQFLGVSANPATLTTSAQGVEHTLQWDFAAEPDLPDDASFVPDIKVFGTVSGGTQEILIGANAAETGLGNDPPVIVDTTIPAAEANGIVGIAFTVADSSDDVVNIRVEYDIVGDDPDVGWKLARPALQQATPAFAFDGVLARSDGSSHFEFFWDTDFDLAELEREVRLRFTAVDPVVEGTPLATSTFRIDNNAEPIATLSGDLLVLNPDQRRGIPIPFTLIDQEADDVELVFQWRHPGDGFPQLPSDPAAIRAIVADPVERKLHHVCTEFQKFARGSVAPIGPTSIQLAELTSGPPTLPTSGIEGCQLEILRAALVCAPVASTWPVNPLAHPVSALSIRDGTEALVLDRPSAGSWRLRQIALATGAVVREIVAGGLGAPDAMALERDEASVLVATHAIGGWRLSRVELATGAALTLITAHGTSNPGAIRAIASLGTHAALVTVGDSLLRLEYPSPQDARAVRLFDDLAMPWGLALDPFDPNRVYVAEHDAVVQGTATLGRIVSIDLGTRERRALHFGAATPAEAVVPGPESLAFERPSNRLFVVSAQSPTGPRRLLSIDLHTAAATASLAITDAFRSTVGSVASGPDGLMLMSLTSEDDLSVGGGLEQSRVIERYDPAGHVAHVSSAFEPPIGSAGGPGKGAARRWRVALPTTSVFKSSPTGQQNSWVWDSGDVSEGGEILLRATPFDSEVGVFSATNGAKQIRNPIDSDPVSLGDAAVTHRPNMVTPVDIDGDGDIDLVSANASSSTLTIFLQTSPGVFGQDPLILGDASVTFAPSDVAAADFDQDGDLDLVSANVGGNNLTVFFQTSPGVFAPDPQSLGHASMTDQPRSVAPADLDGDGDIDIVSANFESDTLTVFFQSSLGVFAPDPLTLGNTALTLFPTFVATADLDGDGDVDLVSANALGDTLTVFFQTSPGVFTPDPLVLGNASVTKGPVSIAPADLDGDGDIDLVSANQGSSTITVFFQTSPGVFAQDPVTIGDASVTDRPNTVASADFDGDGDNDLVCSSSQGGSRLTVFFQTAPGVFAQEPVTVAGSEVTAATLSVAPADLDGDGDIDLVSANIVSDTLSVFLQTNPGSFAPVPLTLGDPSVSALPGSVATADLDADGDVDLVSANELSNTLTVFFQSSPGAFAPEPLSLGDASVTNKPVCVTSVDVDGDGDVDLVSGNRGTNTVTVFFQTSPGVFGHTPISLGNASVTNWPQSVAHADLDADGDVDLVSANVGSQTLTVFFQTSPGVFATDPLSLGSASVTPGAHCVAVADLDGDGDLDLVSANRLRATLSIFFQTSPGVFAPDPLIVSDPALFASPATVAAADFDGDGDIDLVTANSSAFTLVVFFQTSPGVFANPISLGDQSVTFVPLCVLPADLDGDGDFDIVSANQFTHSLTAFFQLSPGVFAEPPLKLGKNSVTNGPQSVAAADLDGDGDVDLVSANRGGSTLTIFWGMH